MKVLAIRGKNLASLEGAFVLDFTKEPLASAGIFTITGQTGSGKSTILDALCLALFDDTPRLHAATETGIEIPDSGNKTIRQDDSRSILRRGTAEGYAEVEFLSLSGEQFRAKWQVNRAQGKTSGALQNTSVTLKNITANEEIYGSKKELLARISALIGLNFEQFTRAVLLAQGDFSTFLKAKGKEKAELLEKLTGMEIYSRISSLIFDKTKTAEQEYKNIFRQLQDVKTLTSEQTEALIAEQQETEQLIKNLDNRLKVIDTKIKWLEDKVQLEKSISEAETVFTGAKNNIAAATPRYEELAALDSVQSIRDTFQQWQTTRQQREENQTALNAKYLQVNREETLSAHKNTTYAALEKQLKNIEEAYAELEPELRRAQDLDIKIGNAETNEAEARKEYETAGAAKQNIEKTVRTLTALLQEKQQAKEKHVRRKAEHAQYQELILKSDALLQSLDFIRKTGKDVQINHRLLEQENALLLTDSEQMEALKAEQEHLNQLLPAEIAILRTALREGEPCPVCGSTYHPYTTADENSVLEEKELSRKKRETAEKIVRLAETMEYRNGKITQLSTLVQTYRQQQNEKIHEIATIMDVFPSWRDRIDTDALQTQIRQMALEWTQCTDLIQHLEQDMAILQTQLADERNKYEETAKHLTIKDKKLSETTEITANLKKERAALLHGNSVDDLKKRHETKKREITEQCKQTQKEQEDLNRKVAESKGFIAQMEHTNRQLTQQYDALTLQKEAWATTQPTTFSDAQLSSFFSKSAQWIESERKLLTELKTMERAALATLEERKKNLAQHEQAEEKPSEENETKTRLMEQKPEIEQQLSEKRNLEIQIKVKLEQNRENEQRRQQYEKEIAIKETLYENWQKLNTLLGAKDGTRFKKIAQEYTLDFLLVHANKQLRELTQRYELQRIGNTLALQVIDLDMCNEVRTVHSLSGGESFLVSLALALGLSSLSSNRMKVESLFIDEGFGSLDVDTLRIAMDALDSLQTQGRKVGVISHVEEMTERIAAQVRVTKTANGKSTVEVTDRLNIA
ncbi:MAG: AAA family ATPase [Bacteroidales bacterium]|jgi:exonuclease SbcC|nr:AAA family ATPase [Bacteroidales bacterium]